MIERAIILAAGTSNRLKPITDDTPKCLLDISGGSILRRQLENLKANNIRNIKAWTEGTKQVKENYNFAEERSQSLLKEREKLIHLKNKLEVRLKQREFIYTEKDVLIFANAIKELDKFYSYYIIQTVKNLEPIINSVITKIDFQLSFKLDAKGDFDIVLYKNDQEFHYADLSTGQRLLLTIGFQVALLLEKGQSGVIIADEGFSSLSENFINELYLLFESLPFQVIAVLHRFQSNQSNINIIELGDNTNVSKVKSENKNDIREKTEDKRRTETSTSKSPKREVCPRTPSRAKKSLALFDGEM